MKFRFLGVRGSISLSDSTKIKIGNNTTCLEIINNNNDRIIIDSGIGIIKLSNEILLEKNKNIHILLTHTHLDHIVGFPFFSPIFNEEYSVTIYSPEMKKFSIQNVFNNLMSTPFFPINLDKLKAKITFKTLNLKEFVSINGFKVYPELHVHPITCYGYRVICDDQIIAFLTDVEHPNGIDERVIRTAENANVLIHDSQYFPYELPSHKNWGHSSYEEAIKTKNLSKAKKLYLTHHDPLRSDIDVMKMLEESRKLDLDVDLAIESNQFIMI